MTRQNKKFSINKRTDPSVRKKRLFELFNVNQLNKKTVTKYSNKLSVNLLALMIFRSSPFIWRPHNTLYITLTAVTDTVFKCTSSIQQYQMVYKKNNDKC